MESAVHHDIGRHEAQIESLQEQVKLLHADMVRMNATLTSIQTTLSEARGGWKVLMMVAGVSSVVGGLFVKLATWANWLPK